MKDKRLESLTAIAYNPSHTNIGNGIKKTFLMFILKPIVFYWLDVSAPFKIFSTLIRGLDNELAPLRKDEKEDDHCKNDED